MPLQKNSNEKYYRSNILCYFNVFPKVCKLCERTQTYCKLAENITVAIAI